MRPDVVVTGEELDEQDAGGETAEVGPESHTASFLAHEPEEASDELDPGPVEKHRPRRQGDGDGKDADRHDAEHAYARIEHEVAAHHAADGTRGADHRNR